MPLSRQIFLPQRLANITSLELTWYVDLQLPNSRRPVPWSGHDASINCLSATVFPSLTRLNLFLLTSEWLHHENDLYIRYCEARLLYPMDALVESFTGGFRECQLTFRSDNFLKLLGIAEMRPNGVIRLEDGKQNGWSWVRFWRRITLGQYAEERRDNEDKQGYWIRGLSLHEFRCPE